MMSKTSVLIIEDEAPVRRFVRSALIGMDFAVLEAETGREGINLIISHRPDVVILDLGLPDMDGMAVIREVRDWSQIPIVILSARGQEKDKVTALDHGADDYVTKPFSVNELISRIKVAIRHSVRVSSNEPISETKIVSGNLTIDLEAHRVFRNEIEIHLTNIEYRLLAALARNQGKILTHRQIMRDVWDKHSYDEQHALRVYVGALRRKIEPNPALPVFIITEQGVGYRLSD